MAILSPLRFRRLAAQQTEATQHLLAFRLRQEWFALPTKSVLKVLPLGKVYGDPQSTGVSLTVYQDKELLVVDVGRRIFRETLTSEIPGDDLSLRAGAFAQHARSAKQSQLQRELQRFLLIVQSARGELVGLPIDSLPSLRRVPESAWAPLPQGYISEANIQCVSSLMIQAHGDEPPIFLLDPDQLVQPQHIVPLLAAESEEIEL